ncbi:MAG: sugar ABC transporter permease [Anaerolineae bacterium]|jgi:arabinogalactan oligomer/maltooligosaccharide transport system permease protein|nr:sugar ABC transporter permease [Anaerolineae bacterium]
MAFLTLDVILASLGEVGSTVLFILFGTAILELLVYFLWKPLSSFSHSLDQRLSFLGTGLRNVISTLLLIGVVVFAVVGFGIGQKQSPIASYWPLALAALFVGAFLSPKAPDIFGTELRLPYMLLAPAFIGLFLLVIYPLIWEFSVSLTNLSPRHFQSPDFIGFVNYLEVFTKPILKQVTFFPVFLRTILWTVTNISAHVIGGMILALLLNREMRLKGLYRTLLVLPWAIPQVIACLAWRGEFHYEYGFVNIMLQNIGLEPIKWMTDPTWNFMAMVITNVWLGIPFMMVIILGGLQSIAGDYYEAAELDGATALQQFTHITLPLLQPVLTPAIILGTIWTFTNFNVPFFINQNELESSDTLVTALFRSAFQYFNLGDAAAFAFVNFGILLVFSIFYIRASGGLKEVYE